METFIKPNDEVIEKLLTYSKDMMGLYNELYILDISGKKNSNEFNDIVDLIIFIKKKEDEIYRNFSFEELMSYRNFFETFRSISFDMQNKPLFSDSEDDVSTRIINFLIFQIETIIEYQNNEFLNQFDNEEKTMVTELLLSGLKKDTFLEDLSIYSFINLDSFIDIINEDEINEIKKYKYVRAFEFFQVERLSLSNNFNLTLDMTNIKKYRNSNEHRNVSFLSALNAIKKVLITNDKIDLIIGLSVLKTLLYILSKDDIIKLIYKMYQFTDKNPNQENKDKVISLINNCLTN